VVRRRGRSRRGRKPVIDPTLRPSRSEAAFLKGLSETGSVKGQNVAIEYHWTEVQNARVPAFATVPTIHDNNSSRVSERKAGA